MKSNGTGKKEYPKVLIISNNVIGLDGNMGKTLHSFFQDWDPEALCQMYFHSEVPTTHLCGQYFRVTDFDLVNAFRFRKPGTVFTSADVQEDRKTTRTDTGVRAKIYRIGSRRTPLMIFVRNALWRLGAWKTKELDDWVRRQAPDMIFLAAGDCVFSSRVAWYLAQKHHLPVVIAIFDDYYFDRLNDRSPVAKWNTWVFRRTMKQMMKSAGGAIYVHPAMQRAYDKAFGTNGQVLYTSAELCVSAERTDGPVRVSYLGGLGLKRDEVLVEIGRLLRKLVPDGSVLVDVYSADTRPEVLAKLTEENGLRFCGTLSPREVRDVEEQSSILLLPDTRSPELVEHLRYSLSTKTAEYLASGRCMLAYGPKEAGVISYLLENEAGCVATCPTELEEKLREVLFSPEKRREYAAGQLALARRNHTRERNGAVLKAVLQEAAERGCL